MQIGKIGTRDSFIAWAAAIRQSVLVINGDSDNVTPLSQSQSVVIGKLKQCKVQVIKESSHQVMQENAEAVNEAILHYLQGLLQDF